MKGKKDINDFFKDGVGDFRMEPPKKVRRKLLLVLLLGKLVSGYRKYVVGAVLLAVGTAVVFFSGAEGEFVDNKSVRESAVVDDLEEEHLRSFSESEVSKNDLTSVKEINAKEESGREAGVNSQKRFSQIQKEEVFSTVEVAQNELVGKNDRKEFASIQKRAIKSNEDKTRGEVNEVLAKEAVLVVEPKNDDEKYRMEVSMEPEEKGSGEEKTEENALVEIKKENEERDEVNNNGAQLAQVEPEAGTKDYIKDSKLESLKLSDLKDTSIDTVTKHLDLTDEASKDSILVLDSLSPALAKVDTVSQNLGAEPDDSSSLKPKPKLSYALAPYIAADVVLNNLDSMKYLPAYSVGVLAGVSIKHSTVYAGVAYSSTSFEQSYTYSMDSVVAYFRPNYDVTEVQEMKIDSTVNGNDSSGVWVSYDTTYVSRLDSSLVTDTIYNNETFDKKGVQKISLNYLTVPLYYAYTFSRGKHGVELSVGTELNFLLNNGDVSGTTPSGSVTVPEHATLNVEKFYINYRVSAAYFYKISGNLEVFTELRYRQVNKSLIRGSAKNRYLGGAIGLKWRFD